MRSFTQAPSPAATTASSLSTTPSLLVFGSRPPSSEERQSDSPLEDSRHRTRARTLVTCESFLSYPHDNETSSGLELRDELRDRNKFLIREFINKRLLGDILLANLRRAPNRTINHDNVRRHQSDVKCRMTSSE